MLAEYLNIQAASVTDKLKKLAQKKWLQYEKSKGVKLTSNGKKIALNIEGKREKKKEGREEGEEEKKRREEKGKRAPRPPAATTSRA